MDIASPLWLGLKNNIRNKNDDFRFLQSSFFNFLKNIFIIFLPFPSDLLVTLRILEGRENE